MSNHYLYAIKYEYGIKIGYSCDYEKRLACYKSSGAEINNIHTVKIPSRQSETNLKQCMKELNLIVDVPNNNQAEEVYRLTEEQAKEIMNILQEGRVLDANLVNTVTKGSRLGVIYMTYMQINEKYDIFYKKPLFQRDLNREHVKAISEYIKTCYIEPHYYLPTIVLAKTTNDHYYIIDGLHRCAAINLIDKTHPCMQMQIPVYIYQELDIADQIKLFRNINKSRPVPQIYLDDEYLANIKKSLITNIKKTYGINSVFIKDTKKTFDFSMCETKLNHLLTNESINHLLSNEIIDDISEGSIFKFIVELNQELLTSLVTLLEIGDLSEISMDMDPDVMDFVIKYYCHVNNIKAKSLKHKTFINAIKVINQYHLDMKNINKKITSRRTTNVKKSNIKKSSIITPFVLGLINKTDLLTAYNHIKQNDFILQ